MTDIPENGSGVEPKLSISGQPKAKGAEVPVAGRRKMVKPKMDFAKALSIMGFSTSRTLDPSGGHDAKVELNAALSRKMADIEKRKRASSKKDEKNKSKLKPQKCISIILTHTLNNEILHIARNLPETRENIKIESHPFYHIICD